MPLQQQLYDCQSSGAATAAVWRSLYFYIISSSYMTVVHQQQLYDCRSSAAAAAAVWLSFISSCSWSSSYTTAVNPLIRSQWSCTNSRVFRPPPITVLNAPSSGETETLKQLDLFADDKILSSQAIYLKELYFKMWFILKIYLKKIILSQLLLCI